VAAVALAAGLVGGGGVLAIDRIAGNAGVRDYLLDHPEVIPEALERLQARENRRAVAAAGQAITRPYAGAWAGNPRGDVTLVEYFDYNCGLCRANLKAVEELVRRDPQVHVVYRDLPVLAPTSRDAARASLAAARAGSEPFNRFHRALYAAGPVTPATIAGAARAAGVTLPADSHAGDDAEIANNLRTAGAVGVSGTPSFVVGDQLLVGVRSLEQLEAAVQAARGR